MIDTFENFHCKPQESIPSFIRKTYDILEEAKFPDIIDWNPEGTTLVIKKTAEFCQKVLPAYFKHSNLTSFVRQLNMYNFRKRRTHSLDHIYHHELFQKGKRHLLKEIKRKTPDSNFEKSYKSPEMPESSQGQDLSNLVYENQILKKLYKDTMARVNVLESEINELSAKNQSLWKQLNGQNPSDCYYQQREEIPNVSRVTNNGVYPSYNEYGLENQIPSQYEASFNKINPMQYLNNNEFSNESTEASQINPENDRGLEWTEPTPSTAPYNQDFPIDETFQLPTQMAQLSQSYNIQPLSEQYMSAQEISGQPQMTNWGNQSQYLLINNNNGIVNDSNNIQTSIQQPISVLGKRQLEAVNTDSQLHGPEPFLKRYEVCNFNKNRLGVCNEGYELGMNAVEGNNNAFYSWSSN